MDSLIIAKKSFQLSSFFYNEMFLDFETTIEVPVVNGTREWKITAKSSSSYTKNRFYTSRLLIVSGQPVKEDDKYDEKCFFKFRALNKEHSLRSIRFKNGLLQKGSTSFVNENLEFVLSNEGVIRDKIKTLNFVLTLGTSNREWRKFGNNDEGHASTIARILEDKVFNDVTIKTTGSDFPCHKCILAASSKYFEVMFTTDTKGRRECVVDWTGVYESETVKTLLRYLYHGEDNQLLDSIKKVYKELVDVARLCQLDKLEDVCETKMMDMLNHICTENNIVEFLLVAEKYELKCLQVTAVEEFTRRFDKIEECEVWKALVPEQQNQILSVAVKVHRDQMVRGT